MDVQPELTTRFASIEIGIESHCFGPAFHGIIVAVTRTDATSPDFRGPDSIMPGRVLQIRVQELLAVMTLVCVALAMVVDEPARVATAALFCFGSVVVLTMLAVVAGTTWVNSVVRSVQGRTLYPLAARARWGIFDGLLAIWTIAVVSIYKFVEQNAVARSDWLVWIALAIAPLLAVWAIGRIRSGVGDRVGGE